MALNSLDERARLLPGAPGDSLGPSTRLGSTTNDDAITHKDAPTRSIEDDVLPETSTLGRTLTWNSAYILVISRIIGSGIFATPGTIFQAVGSPGLSLLLWLAGAVVTATGLAIFLEYGSMLPRSGGHKVYLEYTFRRPRYLSSTVVAINAVVLGFTASNCVIFSQYTLFALGYSSRGDALEKWVAVALLTLVTTIHAVTPKFGIKLQNLLGWIKIGIILLMIFFGLYVVIVRPDTGGDTSVDGQALLTWERLWQDSNWNWNIVTTAFFKVFYSYAGLENINNVLNEVKDPVRTLRSVTMAALATTCILYFLINVAYFLVVPLDELRGSGELIAALFFRRLLGEGLGSQVLPLAVALSAFGNVMVVVFSTARLKHEIARQGFLPFSGFLSSTKPFNSPLGGLLVNYIPSLLVIALPPSGKVYSFILDVEGYTGQITGLVLAIGLLYLRYKRPDLKRPYRAWLSAVVIKLGLSLALLVAPFVPPKERYSGGLFYATYAIVGASTVALSVAYWFVWTVIMPRWGGYSLEEAETVLDDGTTITKLVRSPLQ